MIQLNKICLNSQFIITAIYTTEADLLTSLDQVKGEQASIRLHDRHTP